MKSKKLNQLVALMMSLSILPISGFAAPEARGASPKPQTAPRAAVGGVSKSTIGAVGAVVALGVGLGVGISSATNKSKSPAATTGTTSG
ncbi:MAG: hypothetical protein EPN84_12015 [Legionella sp.]|nr:MAG: hypothetical protein EPN84_12015 [Legionella sp.]